MNIYLQHIIVALFACNAVAWTPIPKTNNNNALQQKLKELTTTSAAVSIGFAVAFGVPLLANAVDFTGSYSDPKHPNCKRNIAVEKGNPTAQISGTDGNPGCPVGGEGKTWALSGRVDGDSLLVDFSPKGGPKDLKGTWDGDGIRWPDGNKWTLN